MTFQTTGDAVLVLLTCATGPAVGLLVRAWFGRRAGYATGLGAGFGAAVMAVKSHLRKFRGPKAKGSWCAGSAF